MTTFRKHMVYQIVGLKRNKNITNYMPEEIYSSGTKMPGSYESTNKYNNLDLV